jgi:hypothetical protein
MEIQNITAEKTAEKIQLKLGADRYLADNLDFDKFKKFENETLNKKIEMAEKGLLCIFHYLDKLNVAWIEGAYLQMSCFPVIVKILDAMNVDLETVNNTLTKKSEEMLFQIRKNAYSLYKYSL